MAGRSQQWTNYFEPGGAGEGCSLKLQKHRKSQDDRSGQSDLWGGGGGGGAAARQKKTEKNIT